MSSDVSVYVLFNDAQKEVGDLAGLLRERRLCGQIVGSGWNFFAGLYDEAPVAVYLARGPHVLEESEDMAQDLAKNNIPADIVTQVRGSDARVEIIWNLTRDNDLVVETVDVLAYIAQAAVDLTGGVALMPGSRRLFRLGSNDTLDTFAQLFPPS